MRIAYCTPGLGPCGGLRVIFEHVNGLVDRGHDVFIVNDGPNTPSWYGELKAPVVSLHVWLKTAAPVDVVVATGFSTAYWAHLVKGSRYYYFIQMMEHFFLSSGSQGHISAIESYSYAHKKGFTLLTIADWLGRELAAEHGVPGVPIIPNGVNKDHFYRESSRKDVPRYIMFEGDNRNPAKDTEGIAWRVGTELRDKFNVELWGYAAYRHSFSDKMNKLILVPSYSEMRNLYTDALFLLKASHWEGRACAPVEAMCCGTPTVRGILQGDDDLRNGYNCLRSSYSYEAVLHNATCMLNDVKLRNQLSRNCLRYAKKHLEWEPIIERLEGIYAR